MKKLITSIILTLLISCTAHIDPERSIFYVDNNIEVEMYGIPVEVNAFGTGFMLMYRGLPLFVTAAHLCKTSETVRVDGHEVKVIYSNKKDDICITEVPAIKGTNYSYLRLAPNDVEVLDDIYSICNKYPREKHLKVRGNAGVLVEDNYFRLTSLISFSGNSGSPILNSSGFVVGVLSAVYIDTHHTLITAYDNFVKALEKVYKSKRTKL